MPVHEARLMQGKRSPFYQTRFDLMLEQGRSVLKGFVQLLGAVGIEATIIATS